MKTLISAVSLITVLAMSSSAKADPIRVGGSVDLGLPSGLGVGVVVAPKVDWLHLGGSLRFNGISPGVEGSVVLSPIHYVVSPQFEFDAGAFFRENMPFNIDNDKFNLQYNYANFMLGLALGNRDKTQFVLSGGAAYIDANIGGLGQASHISNAFFSNPDFHGWTPAAKLAVVFLF